MARFRQPHHLADNRQRCAVEAPRRAEQAWREQQQQQQQQQRGRLRATVPGAVARAGGRQKMASRGGDKQGKGPRTGAESATPGEREREREREKEKKAKKKKCTKGRWTFHLSTLSLIHSQAVHSHTPRWFGPLDVCVATAYEGEPKTVLRHRCFVTGQLLWDERTRDKETPYVR